MSIKKQKVDKNFTTISNLIMQDKKLCFFDRGILVTLFSLPDKWRFSIGGLSSIVPDGVSAITASLKRLEEKGYLKRTTFQNKLGRFETLVEVFYEKQEVNKSTVSVKVFEELDKELEDEIIKTEDVVIKTDDVVIKTDEEILTVSLPKEGKECKGIEVEKEPVFSEGGLNTDFSPSAIFQGGQTDLYNNINKKYKKDRYDRLIDRSSYPIYQSNNNNINRAEYFRELFRKNIDYYKAFNETKKQNRVDELIEIMVSTICSGKTKIRISGTDISTKNVETNFLKIDYFVMRYVLDSLDTTTSNIRNIKAYLLTTLYNAPMTMHIYNRQKANSFRRIFEDFKNKQNLA